MEQASLPGTASDEEVLPEKSSYEIFIAVMTLFSLVTLVPAVLQRGLGVGGHTFEEIANLLVAIDVMFSALFFMDWIRSLVQAPSRRAYLMGERPGRSIPYGLLELLGTVPLSILLRYLRLFRLRRVGWRPRDLKPNRLFRAMVATRAQSAVYVSVIFAFLVIVIGALAMLWFEADRPGALIDTSSDAVWWALVTITTVGYGDEVPVTVGGRVVAVLTMIGGIAIFGVVAGALAGILAPTRPEAKAVSDTSAASDERLAELATEITALRHEIAELRAILGSSQGTPRA